MSRTAAVLIVAVAVAVATVGAPLAVAAGFGDGFPAAADTGNDSVPPGARLAGVVGSQGATIDGELRQRSLSVALSRANGSGAKAAIVANTYENLSERLAALERKKAALQSRYENGTLSRGEYRARVAKLAAEIRAVQRLANTTADAARGLPEEKLAARGVDAPKIDRLRDEAANLSGPEVAAIARNITGEGRGPPADPGPGQGQGPGQPPGQNPSDGRDQRSGDDRKTGQGSPENASDGAPPRTSAPGDGTPTAGPDRTGSRHDDRSDARRNGSRTTATTATGTGGDPGGETTGRPGTRSDGDATGNPPATTDRPGGSASTPDDASATPQNS